MWSIAIVMPNGALRVERGMTDAQCGGVVALCLAFNQPYALFLED